MAATQEELKIAKNLRAKGYGDQVIIDALQLRREKAKAEAARQAKIAEAIKKQEEAEKAAFEEQKLEQASIYGEYDSEEMQDLVKKGNDAVTKGINDDLARLTKQDGKYNNSDDRQPKDYLLSYGDDDFVAGTLNRTFSKQGFKFKDTGNDQITVTFGGSSIKISTDHVYEKDDIAESERLQKWMKKQLDDKYQIGGSGNNYRAIANKNGKLEWHYIDADGNSKGKVKNKYLLDGLKTTNPEALNKNRYKQYTARSKEELMAGMDQEFLDADIDIDAEVVWSYVDENGKTVIASKEEQNSMNLLHGPKALYEVENRKEGQENSQIYRLSTARVTEKKAYQKKEQEYTRRKDMGWEKYYQDVWYPKNVGEAGSKTRLKSIVTSKGWKNFLSATGIASEASTFNTVKNDYQAYINEAAPGKKEGGMDDIVDNDITSPEVYTLQDDGTYKITDEEVERLKSIGVRPAKDQIKISQKDYDFKLLDHKKSISSTDTKSIEAFWSGEYNGNSSVSQVVQIASQLSEKNKENYLIENGEEGRAFGSSEQINFVPGEYNLNGENIKVTQQDIDYYNKWYGNYEINGDHSKNEEKWSNHEKEKKEWDERYNSFKDKSWYVESVQNLKTSDNKQSIKDEIKKKQPKWSYFYDDNDLSGIGVDDMQDFEMFVEEQMKNGLFKNLDISTYGYKKDEDVYESASLQWDEKKGKFFYSGGTVADGYDYLQVDKFKAQALQMYLTDRIGKNREVVNNYADAGIISASNSLDSSSAVVAELDTDVKSLLEEYKTLQEDIKSGKVKDDEESKSKLEELSADINGKSKMLEHFVGVYNETANNEYNQELFNKYNDLVEKDQNLIQSFNNLITPNKDEPYGIKNIAKELYDDEMKKQERLHKAQNGHVGWQIANIAESGWGALANTVFGLAGMIEAEVPRLVGMGKDAKGRAQVYNMYSLGAEQVTWDAVGEGSVIDEETGEIQWTNIAPTTAAVVVDMVMMMRTGGLIKGAVSATSKLASKTALRLGKTLKIPTVGLTKLNPAINRIGKLSSKAQIANRAAQFSGSSLVIFPKNVQEAVSQIDDDFTAEDAMKGAFWKTATESAIEMFNPDIAMFPKLNKFKQTPGWGNYKLWKNGTNATKTINLFKQSIKQIPAEILEEFSQEAASGLHNAYRNQKYNTNFELPGLDSFKELGLITPASILSMGAVRTRGFRRGKPDSSLYTAAIEDFDGFSSEMLKRYNNGDIDADNYMNIMQTVNGFNLAKNSIDPEQYANMTNIERQETLSLLYAKNELQKSIKESTDPTQTEKLRRDLKNVELDIKRVAKTVETGYVSREQQAKEFQVVNLKAQWKNSELGSKKRQDLKVKIQKAIKERNDLREKASLYEFNGKHFNSASKFIAALQKAKANGYFDKGKVPKIRISNKVNSKKAAYVAGMVNDLTGKSLFKKGEVLMSANDVQETSEFLTSPDNQGKTISQLRQELLEERRKKNPNTNRINDLQNAVKLIELQGRGYELDEQAGGMIIKGRENQALKSLEDQEIQRNLGAVQDVLGQAGLGMAALTQEQIDEAVAAGELDEVFAEEGVNAFIHEIVRDGKPERVVVVNKDMAKKYKRNTAASHELLHMVLFSVLNGPIRTVKGPDGRNYQTRLTEEGAKLIQGFLDLLPADHRNKLETVVYRNGYKNENFDKENGAELPFEVYAEEYLTHYHDLVVSEKGELKIDITQPDNRSVVRKVVDYFKDFLKTKVEEDVHEVIDINIKTPQQLLDFLNTYNKQAIEGKFSDQLVDMATSSSKLYAETTPILEDPARPLSRTQFSRSEAAVNEEFGNEQRERLVQRVNDIYADPNMSVDEKAGLIAEEYRGMAEVRFEVAVATAPSQQIRDILINNKEDVIAEMLYDPGDGKNKARNVLGLVRDFEVEKQKYRNIAAYINKYFRVRAYEAISKITKDKMFKQQFEEAQGSLQETEAQEADLNEDNQFAAGQIVVTNKLTQNDPFNENLKRQINEYNEDINNQIDQDPSIYTSKTYKTLKDLNPRKTIERMVNDQMVNGAYGKVYVDNGSPFWKTTKGKRQLGTPIVDGILKKLTNNDNLNQQDIKALQPYISKHASTLKISLPQGFMTDKNNRPTKATGVQNVLLEPFYIKGKRVGNLFPQRKRTDIGVTEFLNVFGITPAGEINITGKESNVSQRVKALIEQHGRVATNQQVRNRLEQKGIPQEQINEIANGKSNLVFSRTAVDNDVNPVTNEIEPGYNQREADVATLMIMALRQDPKQYDYMAGVYPEVATLVDQFLQNVNESLGAGKNYIPFVRDDKFTPTAIKELIETQGARAIWKGGKINPKDPKNKSYIEKYSNQTRDLGMSFHPNFPTKTLLFLLGYKQGRTLNKKDHVENVTAIENRSQEFNEQAELEFLERNGFKRGDLEALKNIQPMVFDGRIKKILEEIHFATDENGNSTRAAKLAKMTELQDEIAKINEANHIAFRYVAAKMKEAYNRDGTIDAQFVFTLGQVQTNIVEGLRALSSFKYVYLTDGLQLPFSTNRSGKKVLLKKPDVNKRSNQEYYTSNDWNNYISSWEQTTEWQEFKTKNEKLLGQAGKVKVGNKSVEIGKDISMKAAVEVATINDLLFKNEHVGASATSNAELVSHVYSNGQSISLDNVGFNHESGWLTKVLASPEFIDAKVNIAGKEVDNKTSLEADYRLVKFTKGKDKGIYHFSGKNVVDYLSETDGIIQAINEVVRMTGAQSRNDKVVTKAVQLSRTIDENTPARGMSAFDFDETLIDKGDNFIIAKRGDDVVRIGSAQWPIQGPLLAEQGYEFDFTDFVNVRGGVEGPLMQKLRNRIEKYGIENNYILTARPPESAPAIKAWLETQGIDMPIENITGLGNSTGEAKALWIADKFSQGYNDVYFVDDALPNVEAVANIMDQLDIKGSSVQARINFSRSMPDQFSRQIDGQTGQELDLNRIIEQTMGDAAEKRYSNAQAKIRGSKKGRFNFFVPPSAEDFKGLLYRLVGKGRQGEQHIAFFKRSLLDPFARAYTNINRSTQQVQSSYRQILKAFPEVKKQLKENVPGTQFTQEQAVRVYLWNKAGYDVPGLSQTDLNRLTSWVSASDGLKAFSEQLSKLMNQPVGYTPPTEFWLVENILSDIQTLNNEVTRDEHLAEFKQNRAKIFGEWQGDNLVGENMNKLEALYGTNYRDALQDILYRMEYGRKREQGKNKLVNAFNNWANQSVGAIMFFNMRSALLQTISSINFVNWSDNNPLKAATAFANQKQFWKDFSMIFNSDMLKQRRAGNQRGINEAELAAAIAGSTNKAKAALNWLLTKGFLPTQIADSFAIASGGATFYRNRVNTYLKQGLSQQEAQAKAFNDFQEIAEESQQSSRPDLISQQQASPLGRYILAFKNTPMQYARLMKKAFLDIKNGRGDFKSNLSKIIYYGMVQNLIFNGLQAALGALVGDDDEEKDAKTYERVLNGMLDSVLGGLGFGGNAVVTIKNSIREYLKQKNKGWGADHTYTMLQLVSFSPTIGSKLRKIYSGIQTEKFNEDVIKKMDLLDIDNPVYSALANVISGVTNIPLDRLVKKVDNIDAAITEDISMVERIALLLGWNTWDLGIEDQDIIAIEEEIKKDKDKQRKEKSDKKKQEKKKEQEEENKVKEEENKKKEDGGCIAINRKGERCKNEALPGKNYCTIHDKVEQRADGTKVQCSQIKSDGDRCKMKTSNKSGKCYYHD